MSVKEQISQLSDEMLDTLSRLVKYNSVQEDAIPGKPFGEGPAAALKEALDIAGEMGFETKNLDNYCGYAQMGEGSDIIGIVGHLDIVAAGDGWNTDPFTMVRNGDYVYGRGVSDDKGPVVASLYAMKLIKESGVELNKRVRLIFGCNEETGSLCMKHYNEVEEPVTCGFTPDGDFPGIFGEKAICRMTMHSKNTSIIAINGGISVNAICSACTTVIPAGFVDTDSLKKALEGSALVSFDIIENADTVTIRAEGKAAHASTPRLGINAISETLKALETAGACDDFVSYYNSHIGTSCDGAGYGIKLSDDYGELTLCNGMIRTVDGQITATVDIRVPVTVKKEQFTELCKPYLEDAQGMTTFDNYVDSLFIPKDSPLVKALHSAYSEVTGDTVKEPMVIGGGTYAKSIPGIIAYGGGSEDGNIHDVNEKLRVSDFLTATEIYVNAINKLLAI